MIDISNIEPGAASVMNRSLSGHRQSSTEAHWFTIALRQGPGFNASPQRRIGCAIILMLIGIPMFLIGAVMLYGLATKMMK